MQYACMAIAHENGVGEDDDHTTQPIDREQSISESVVDVVAEYTGVEREALPAVDDSINPDGLNTLFEVDAEGGCPGGCVTFSYYQHTVVVQSTGQIMVRPN